MKMRLLLFLAASVVLLPLTPGEASATSCPSCVTPNLYTALGADGDGGLPRLFADLHGSGSSWQYVWGIPMSSNGLAVDSKGDLYVASDTYPQAILVYPPTTGRSPPQAPLLVLDDRGFDPTGIAVKANGTVIVANLCLDPLGNQNIDSCVIDQGGPPGSTGNIVAYRPGATKPYVRYTPPSGQFQPNYLAVDKRGDVFTSMAQAFVWECTSPKVCSQINWGWTNPTGMEVDASDHLVVLDVSYQRTGPYCLVFSIQTHALLRKFSLASPGMGAAGPQVMTLDSTNANLYFNAWDSRFDENVIAVYNYQTGGYEYDFVPPGGATYFINAIAANPPSIPGT